MEEMMKVDREDDERGWKERRLMKVEWKKWTNERD